MQKKYLAAIYQKVARIYEDEASGKFLCLPDSFLTLSPEDIRCLGSLETGQDVETFERNANTIYDFSRRINSPIRGLTTRMEEGEMLWEVYDNILRYAVLAKGSVDAEAEKKYQDALAVLFNGGELRAPSPDYAAYRSYRDQYFKAMEEYDQIRFSSSTATGDEADALQSKLALAKSQLADIQRDWTLFGHKERIEEALNIFENSLITNPHSFWKKLKDSFNPDIDLRARAGKDYYATTYIFPTSFIDEKWDTVSIYGRELSELYKSAPDEIKSICKDNREVSDISLIKMEYRSVRVERPWFNSNIFKSRLWRMPVGFDQTISFGSEKLLGRFPAYVSALLLLRNGTITYSSGKTERLLGSSTQDGADQDVSILAYICKRILASPNPDENADWPVSQNTAYLDIQKSLGGTVYAYLDGNEVDSGHFVIGQTIKIKAVPNDGYMLSKWTINGIVTEHPKLTYECPLPENGLTVIPEWTLDTDLDPKHFKIEKDTLVSMKNGPDKIDMNQSSALSQVRIIGKKAFKGFYSLRDITIGEHVEIIEDQAFSDCGKLERVFIPSSTRLIGKNVFAEDNSLDRRIIEVHPDNKKYASLDGVLVEKNQLCSVQTLTCRCGTKFIIGEEAPSICPKCGGNLNTLSPKEEVIRKPDAKVPFRVLEKEAEAFVRKHYNDIGFTTKAFKEQLSHADIHLAPVYAPSWEWSLRADGEIHVQTIDHLRIRNHKLEGNSHRRDVSINVNIIQVPASQIVSVEGFGTGNESEDSFSFDQAPDRTAFELYSKNLHESRKNEREQVAKSLREKAQKVYNRLFVLKTEDGSIHYEDETNRLLFHPFWVGSFQCGDKSYSFSVDGNSGKVTSNEKTPKIWKRTAAVAGLALVGIALLVFAILLIATLITQTKDTQAPTVNDKALQVSAQTGDGFTIGWERARDNRTAEDKIHYQVLLKGPGDTDWRTIAEGPSISSYQFSDLIPDSEYSCTVKAKDAKNNTLLYDPLNIRTQKPVPIECRVVLTEIGSSKLQVIKVVKEKLDIGLREAKELVDRAALTPVTLLEKTSASQADQLKVALENAGAKVEIAAPAP